MSNDSDAVPVLNHFIDRKKTKLTKQGGDTSVDGKREVKNMNLGQGFKTDLRGLCWTLGKP